MTDTLFGRILIATDGSDKNRSAVDEGIRIAKAGSSILNVVYVIDTGTFSSVSGDIPIGDTYRLFQDEAQNAFARIRSLAGDVPVETSILEGRPAPEIVKFAAAQGIDLIVIGTQGKKGFERLLLGSVAEEIIRSAPCKVLVVK
ncbi:MAG: universal stress protein [Methanoregula sp.]|nr:universal stress protein [Methanoregula sp.]